MLPIFTNPQLQQHFDQKGWAVIDLLTPNEVQDLLSFYHAQNNPDVPEHGFSVSLDSPDTHFTQGVIEKLTQVMGAKADAHFQNHRYFTGSFVVKEPAKQGIVPPHQDWTFVEEPQFCSATVWTPLADVTINNGALGVISGSHRFFAHPRPSPAPIFKAPFDPHIFAVFPYLEIIELKAGQALVFNNQTIHASPPNVTDNPRIAAGIGVTQKDAQLIHCYLKPQTQPPVVEIYRVNEQFFPTYNNARLKAMYQQGKTPADDGWEKITEMPLQIPEISAQELINLILLSGNSFNYVLAAKMAALFGYQFSASDANNPDAQKKQNTEPQADTTLSDAATPENWRTIYTPRRIAAEIQHKISRARNNPQLYTPANIAAEIKHRITQSVPLKKGLLAVAGLLALRFLWAIIGLTSKKR
ncbi:MAG TPA: phytanoyl-CoA dioxygenase family protein [Chitinophagales bacterium]|nr:phytanoyl-CoA dioxygenase family protein [Chitinophagales bacterium]